MRKTVFVILAMSLFPAFAVDGVVLVNQSTVMAAGGFPYTITQSGSYRLSGNLTVPDANTSAISITADNVTIDLNGFSIIGPTVCTGGLYVTSCSPTGSGVGVFSLSRSISVANGSVRGMGHNGIFLFSVELFLDGIAALSNGNSVEKVHAGSNGAAGIVLGFGTVSGNTATGNLSIGILASGTISGNTASGNGKYGIQANCPSSVVGNTANFNATNLFLSASGCVAANNAAP